MRYGNLWASVNDNIWAGVNVLAKGWYDILWTKTPYIITDEKPKALKLNLG